MIVERFKNQDPIPVYRRFRDRGRLAPEGLRFVKSWVDERLEEDRISRDDGRNERLLELFGCLAGGEMGPLEAIYDTSAD